MAKKGWSSRPVPMEEFLEEWAAEKRARRNRDFKWAAALLAFAVVWSLISGPWFFAPVAAAIAVFFLARGLWRWLSDGG